MGCSLSLWSLQGKTHGERYKGLIPEIADNKYGILPASQAKHEAERQCIVTGFSKSLHASSWIFGYQIFQHYQFLWLSKILQPAQSLDLLSLLSPNLLRSSSNPGLVGLILRMSASCTDEPVRERSAMISPKTLQNLKPCPEHGEQIITWSAYAREDHALKLTGIGKDFVSYSASDLLSSTLLCW